MHPRDNIIALMAKAPTGTGNVVQIFNMAERAKLKDLSFTENIVYWHWVSLQKLAIVTTTSVYHVNLANNNPTE
jgi:clathrin heavy chain